MQRAPQRPVTAVFAARGNWRRLYPTPHHITGCDHHPHFYLGCLVPLVLGRPCSTSPGRLRHSLANKPPGARPSATFLTFKLSAIASPSLFHLHSPLVRFSTGSSFGFRLNLYAAFAFDIPVVFFSNKQSQRRCRHLSLSPRPFARLRTSGLSYTLSLSFAHTQYINYSHGSQRHCCRWWS